MIWASHGAPHGGMVVASLAPASEPQRDKAGLSDRPGFSHPHVRTFSLQNSLLSLSSASSATLGCDGLPLLCSDLVSGQLLGDFSNDQHRRLLIFTILSEELLSQQSPQTTKARAMSSLQHPRGPGQAVTCVNTELTPRSEGCLPYVLRKPRACVSAFPVPTSWRPRPGSCRGWAAAPCVGVGACHTGHHRLPQGPWPRRPQLLARLCWMYSLNTHKERELPGRGPWNQVANLGPAHCFLRLESVPFTSKR